MREQRLLSDDIDLPEEEAVKTRIDTFINALLHENNNQEVFNRNLDELLQVVRVLINELILLQIIADGDQKILMPVSSSLEPAFKAYIKKQEFRRNLAANVIQKIFNTYLKTHKDLSQVISTFIEYLTIRKGRVYKLIKSFTADRGFSPVLETEIGQLLSANTTPLFKFLGTSSDGDKLLVLENLYFTEEGLSADVVKEFISHFEWVAKNSARDDQAIAFSLSFALDPYFSKIEGKAELRQKMLEVGNSFASEFPLLKFSSSNWNNLFLNHVLERFKQKKDERAELASLLFVIFFRANGSIASLKLGGVPHNARMTLAKVIESLKAETLQALELELELDFIKNTLVNQLSEELEQEMLTEQQKALKTTFLNELKNLESLIKEKNYAAALPLMIVAGARISFKNNPKKERLLI